MRIALVVPGGVDRSGEYRVIPALVALIGRLSRQHDVDVLALYQAPEPDSWELAGANVHNIGTRWTYPRAVRKIRSLSRTAPFDVIHAIWSGPCGLVAVLAARVLGVPSLIHIAGGELAAIPDIEYGGRQSWRGCVREALVLRAASAVTAASSPVIKSLADLGVAARRVPLGVDLHGWPPREPVAREAGRAARLIHVASLNRVKDQPMLLNALDRLAKQGLNFEMDVVGEDTLLGEVQDLAARLNLSSRVRFHGFLPQKLLRPLVEAADLLIVSSRHETGPLAMLEAAVVGVPTVGTAVGHVAEWSPHAAVAVPVADSAALAEAIANLLADEPRRLGVAREAYVWATREDADFTARCFQELYAELRSFH